MTDRLNCLRTSGFTIFTAQWLARASELAYENDATIISNWGQYQGFASVTAFNRGNIQGYWAIADDVAVLVLRGTSNIGQWIRDARLLPVSHPWGKAHKGFVDGLDQVDKDLHSFEQAALQVENVWIAGHSLGGALAVLAAARFWQKGIAAWVYTYGQPRVGLGEFAARFDAELPDRLWRVINQSDIVARLPPGLLYRHCGQVKRIVRPGHLEIAGSPLVELTEEELPPLPDADFGDLLQQLAAHPEASTADRVELEGRLPLFRDHSILEYIRLLEEMNDSQD